MPVWKYKRFEDMPRPARVADEHLAATIRAVWSRASRLSPANLVRGVNRFRSIDEANEARANQVHDRMRASARPPGSR